MFNRQEKFFAIAAGAVTVRKKVENSVLGSIVIDHIKISIQTSCHH